MLTTPTERIVVTQITHLTTQLLAHDDATHQYTTHNSTKLGLHRNCLIIICIELVLEVIRRVKP